MTEKILKKYTTKINGKILEILVITKLPLKLLEHFQKLKALQKEKKRKITFTLNAMCSFVILLLLLLHENRMYSF